jgi:hypothetical protein
MFKPELHEYDSRISAYINEVPDKDLISLFSSNDSIEFYRSIPSVKHEFKYAEGKWSIKEIMNHIIDGERIFSFRALWFARNNSVPLPGYDDNNFALLSNASSRNFIDILEEFSIVRKSSLLLFKSFDEVMLSRRGKFDDKFATVKALGYIILGHELHHERIIKEKYF